MDEGGFTVIELSIVMAVIAILMTIAVPRFATTVEQSAQSQCAGTRNTINGARIRYSFDLGVSSPTITALTEANYIVNAPRCTSRGAYVWVGTGDNRRVFCSVHGQ